MNPLNLIERQETADHIEEYLITRDRWIPAEILSEDYGVSKRSLRGEDSPIRSFAISSDQGYLHITKASDEEWNMYYNRIRSHAISELRRIQGLKKKRVSERQTTFEITEKGKQFLMQLEGV